MGSDTLVTVDLKYLDGTVRMDKGASRRRQRSRISAVASGDANLRQSFYVAEDQVINGSSGKWNQRFETSAVRFGIHVHQCRRIVGAGLTSVYMGRSTPDERDFMA